MCISKRFSHFFYKFSTYSQKMTILTFDLILGIMYATMYLYSTISRQITNNCEWKRNEKKIFKF